jgi:hypothetical protein
MRARRKSLFAIAALLLLARHAIAQADFAIYKDSLVNGWQSWSWAKVNTADSSVAHGGSNSIAVAGSAWQALYLHIDHFDTATYNALSFWIDGGSGGGQLLRVAGVVNNKASSSTYDIPALKPNAWQEVVIPLAALGVAGAADFDGFQIQDRSGKPQPTYHVGDIKLIAAPPPDVVHISIDAARILRTADAGMFGINTAVYDGRLDTPGTIALLKEMGIQALRFPGGSTADGYHWASGTSGTNPWQWPASFDKFAHVAAGVQAREVFITVNYGSGTPDEAAAWVKYSNVTRGYGFKYWEVGNENYGNWEIDNNSRPHDPATYAARFKDYWTRMKAADPGIGIGAVAEVGEDTDATYKDHSVTNPRTGAAHSGWTPVMLSQMKSLGVTPDFLIYHKYGNFMGDAGLMQQAPTWSGDAADLRGQLADYLGAAGAAVELICTENNGPITSGSNPQSTSLVDGLYFADSMGAALQTEFRARVWWDLRNSPKPVPADDTLYGWRSCADDGAIYGDATPSERYPTYYCGKLLKYFASGGDKIVQAASDYSLISAYASQRQNGSLSLLVINKTPNSALNAEIAIAGFTPDAIGTVYSYGIPQDTAARTGSGSPDIAQTNIGIAGPQFSRTFPPCSATVISLLRSR